jgi:hypothetical protein
LLKPSAGPKIAELIEFLGSSWNMKRRTVGPNKRSFTGRHVGTKRTPTVRFESGLERDLLTLVRFREDFIDVVEQPVTVEFTDSTGKERSYTPDFKVVYRSKTVIYEVKYRDELERNWDLYREHVRYMRSWARREGMYFRIVTELTIRTVRFENFRLITPFRHDPVPAEMAARIAAALGNQKMSVLELAQRLCPALADRGHFYPALWGMLAHRTLATDFDSPLGMQALVWNPA